MYRGNRDRAIPKQTGVSQKGQTAACIVQVIIIRCTIPHQNVILELGLEKRGQENLGKIERRRPLGSCVTRVVSDWRLFRRRSTASRVVDAGLTGRPRNGISSCSGSILRRHAVRSAMQRTRESVSVSVGVWGSRICVGTGESNGPHSLFVSASLGDQARTTKSKSEQRILRASHSIFSVFSVLNLFVLELLRLEWKFLNFGLALANINIVLTNKLGT
jgi:hypothetical protein